MAGEAATVISGAASLRDGCTDIVVCVCLECELLDRCTVKNAAAYACA
jgi:hypothetical protein